MKYILNITFDLRFSIVSFFIRFFSTLFSTPIWLDDLNCNSASTDIRLCASAVGRHNCQHSEDIFLTCEKGNKDRLTM